MSMKLYVRNLAFATLSQDLQELFASAGTVESASVVEDRDTGRSRGFGFVEMSSKEEGEAAIAQFNGKEVNGRALNVNEAKPRENRGGGGGRGFGGGGGGGRGGGGGYGGNRGGGGGYGGGGGGGQSGAPRGAISPDPKLRPGGWGVVGLTWFFAPNAPPWFQNLPSPRALPPPYVITP